MGTSFLHPELFGFCLFVMFLTFDGLSANHGPNTCSQDETICEFYLEVSNWLPMRNGYGRKVYINDTDGNLYVHGDDSLTPVDPADVVLADGSPHDRVLTLFNQSMPGPSLTVYVGQKVLVHVTNKMLSDGVTIHWHGIDMRGTPWMDGAAFVTQCPILPGQTFVYKFRPNRSGTYFYHSHTGAQFSMGLFGAFIVKEKKTPVMEEHVLFLQDYDNLKTSDDIWADTALLGDLVADGAPRPPTKRIDGIISSILSITSTLINGRGRVQETNGTHLTKTPLFVYKVNNGARYRFRVIGGNYGYQHKVSVDGHKLKVIAADGIDTEPVIVDYIVLHSGERFDFVLEANLTSGNYWIRAETFHYTYDLTGLAILRYANANDEDPVSTPTECTEDNPCTVINCPFAQFPNWTCITTDMIRAADSNTPAPTPIPGKFKEFFINVGFAQERQGVIYGHMNGVINQLPTVSALTQPREVTGLCESHHDCQPDKSCFCNLPINVDFGDVVQITFISPGPNLMTVHPIHMHGYAFHVLKVGYRTQNLTLNTDINCPNMFCYNNAGWSNSTWYGGNIPDVDLSRAPRKDTFTLPDYGYVTIRFVADKPGLWFIHCHLPFHNSKGMGILLNDSFTHIPKPPAGFPECRNFPPPEWLVEQGNTTPQPTSTGAQCTRNEMYCRDRATCASFCDGNVECDGGEDEIDCPTESETMKEEGTFSKGEFWGMFGTMLFVVLLQFIIAIACISRRNTKHSMNF